ncbi:hypothetical protein [Phyllobacterium sp. SB3]|uniref:hypothetical protein n=1 Tax=Phyllobacterium sp. SB3 TaxID=3156073 RepID=UPI0032AEC9DE
MNGRVVPTEHPEVAGEKLLASVLAGTALRAKTNGLRQSLSHIDAAKQQVAVARAAADQSLLRAKAAPRPHEISNPAFVELFEAHQRDREVLFAAMRALEHARSAAE